MDEPRFIMSQMAFKDPRKSSPFEWLQINPMHTILHCNCSGHGMDRFNKEVFELVPGQGSVRSRVGVGGETTKLRQITTIRHFSTR